MRASAFLVACLIGSSVASSLVPQIIGLERTAIKPITPGAKPTECPTCINMMAQVLDAFWDAVGNGGIIGGCEQLCGYLPRESEWVACSAICIYAGIEEMVRVLNSTDPDPVYMCEEINICPISDTAAAAIESVVVDPPTGPLGTTFYINMSFAIINTTGTGFMQMWAVPPNTPYEDGLGEEAFLIELGPGQYKVSFSLPTSDKQVEWPYGVYNCSVWLCEGYCDSIHKHQYVMASQQNLLFTLTKKDDVLAVAA